MDRARRRRGGYGLGEGNFGLVDLDLEVEEDMAARCFTCDSKAVLYFVESAEETMQYACLKHAAAVAYDMAVASTADPSIPKSERGADDRRWRQSE
jgi:hypothetical protein